ncbi:MAG: diguanylate cyclase [Rhodospirillum sp.]|nr:diguanylate cyclase [Rhodospirillum sp.]MCF8488875.1 diguanylate cyclase [Rhodospirillum sp.]MCF8502751.1 diguanylate cyclase [Rhodospirillum sp.]
MPETRTILIADDDPGNIEILSDILDEDYEILFAMEGPRTLELVREQMPDLVILDVMMPGLSGYEVCRELKKDPVTEKIPVIFLTSLDNDQGETYGLELGAIDYISKPIRPGIVKVRVRNHMELKKTRDLLEVLSSVDGLTGVANRGKFHQKFSENLKLAKREARTLALMLLDLDHFKTINDTYGHVVGDEVLQKVAACCVDACRDTDVVARLGGDEFAVLLVHPNERESVEKVAQKILEALQKPMAFQGHSVQVGASIGIAFYPDDGLSDDDLIKKADSALYGAKGSGRNRYCS